MTYPSSRLQSPIVPRPREGHRRRFNDDDKRRIFEEAAQPGASTSEVARRYGINRRLLCRWKQELSPPAFVTVEITDAPMNARREGEKLWDRHAAGSCWPAQGALAGIFVLLASDEGSYMTGGICAVTGGTFSAVLRAALQIHWI